MIRKQIEWLFKQANVDIEEHRNDLKNIRKHLMKNLDDFKDTHFVPVSPEDIKKYCPTIFKKIQEWKIEDRIAECALILVKPGAHYGIHRDFPTWKKRNIALNFPVENCENSYTVFYQADIIKEKIDPTYAGDNVYVAHSQRVNEENAVEIGRCDSSIPSWINVFVPHAPIVNHNNVRVALSIRFHPELFDLIENGIFDSSLVKQT